MGGIWIGPHDALSIPGFVFEEVKGYFSRNEGRGGSARKGLGM